MIRQLGSDQGPEPGSPSDGRLLSVVIPSYNHSRFIGEAISSVLGQTYEPLELIIIDDGSTDDSPAVIRSAITDKRIEHLARVELIEQPNRGAHDAIMRGIDVARGQLLSILNSDDCYHPHRFALMAPLLDPSREQLALSGVAFIDGESRPLPDESDWPRWYSSCLDAVRRSPTISYALLTHNFSVTSGNFIFTRRLYDRLDGFSEHRFTHDWDFLIRSTYFSEPRYVPDRLISYRIHEANTTETVRHLIDQECSEALARYLALYTDGPSPNRLAPSPHNWPGLFRRFTEITPAFFAPEHTLAEMLPVEV